jgi:hypothetical protein
MKARQPSDISVSVLQAQAWVACNEAHHRPDGEIYRSLGRELYWQDMHERIQALLDRSERQNERLDAHLQEAAGAKDSV